jgi:peptidoglycan/LPS O-acetylase OafA/YrhL
MESAATQDLDRALSGPVSTGISRIAAFDGLRGVAIAMVLWYHVWQVSWLSVAVPFWGGPINLQVIPETGFLGVELFFFLSGFCVFYPFAKAHFDGKPSPAWGHFYLRRFLKIVPSYVLVVVVLLAFGVQKYATLEQGARDVALHLLFIHNWFAATYGSINGVLWSLGVEAQFYVVFPLLCLAFLRRPALCFAALVGLAIAFRTFVEAHNHYFYSQLINQLPAVVDIFAVGMLVAYLHRYVATRQRSLADATTGWTVVAIVGVLFVGSLLQGLYATRYDPGGLDVWQGHYRTELALGFGAVGLGTLFAHRAWVSVIANPVLIFLGAISYNLYLWHQVAAHALESVPWLRPLTPNGHEDPHWQAVYTPLAAAAGIVVATLVTYAFERPILNLGRGRPRASGPHGSEKPRANDAAYKTTSSV